MSDDFTITITAELLEKLGGLKKKPEARPPPARLTRLMPPDVSAYVSRDPQLSRVLFMSRRVGDLLLRHEEEEMQHIKAVAEEVASKYYKPTLPADPCQSERQACVDCYREHPQDVLVCSSLVRAFSTCANQAVNATVRS